MPVDYLHNHSNYGDLLSITTYKMGILPTGDLIPRKILNSVLYKLLLQYAFSF